MQDSLHILVVDDEANIRKLLSIGLEAKNHKVVAVSNFNDAVKESTRKCFDLAFVDLRLGMSDGLDLIPALLASTPWMKIIVITAYSSIHTAVEAMRRGAVDYIPKPFTSNQIFHAVEKFGKMRSLEQKVFHLEEEIGLSKPSIDFTSKNNLMLRTLALAREVAVTDSTILLTGESGTGKSALARAIHNWSHRASKPLGIVSCPSIGPELLESQMFGHIKGAFTGAVRDNSGKIAACEGGTLFLDEIGELPLPLQPKLLRFMQDFEYERVGDHVTRQANVRIIAATNADLETAVKENRFRLDLFYRLNVIRLTVPPLRDHPEDIPFLAEHFLFFFARKNRRTFSGFTDEALAHMQLYEWPGNIRELANVVERATILSRRGKVGTDSIAITQIGEKNQIHIGDSVSLSIIEEEHIRKVLGSAKSLQEAADILGIDQATLWRRRKQYQI
jgi:NtrC-family two-component system response regulator AlgB